MKRLTLLGIVLAAAWLLSACGASDAELMATEDALRTMAVSTMHAQFTQDALLNPSATNTLPPTLTLAPTNTLPPAPTATSAPAGVTGAFPTSDTCDFMAFVGDVNFPDGTRMSPGTSFTKTWRIQNNGTCTWTTAYTVGFDSGDQMSGAATWAISSPVAPGETLDISVNLQAPATPGIYTGYWALRNPEGFDIGVFYVQIEVQ